MCHSNMINMKPIDTLQDLTKKIFEVTVKIQTLYPELYFLLNKTLLFITQNEKYITNKTELIYGNKLGTKEKMELEIFEYIEVWHNKKKTPQYSELPNNRRI